MENKIKPTVFKGTRDFLPLEIRRRNAVMKIIQEIFEKFGYSPIETPILCPAETILGKYGDEGGRLTYTFTDRGGRKVALPYDLTVPFARYVAANYSKLPLPFKRYQIQRVWRAEKPQKGRLREFYQCDIDIVGSRSLIGEAEIARIIVEVVSQIGIEVFTIKINSRRLMNTVLQSFGVPEERTVFAIRIIDKLAKIGKAAVIDELKAIGLTNSEEILAMLEPDSCNANTLHKLSRFRTTEIEEFFRYCKKLSVPENYLRFDPTLARGLDYYTGLVFEVSSADASLGAICAGGRYDNLCSLFCKEDFSGVGVSFGFERIMLLMEKLDLFNDLPSTSRVLVALFDKDSVEDALETYNMLIDSGIPSEIYLEPAKLARQFKYADRKQIPFVIIRGPGERGENTVTVKQMKNGKQKTIPANQLTSYLSGYYEA